MNEEQKKVNQDCADAIINLVLKLSEAKPKDQSGLARKYQITITELEKAYAYFRTWVIELE